MQMASGGGRTHTTHTQDRLVHHMRGTHSQPETTHKRESDNGGGDEEAEDKNNKGAGGCRKTFVVVEW